MMIELPFTLSVVASNHSHIRTVLNKRHLPP
jgi:hypothetical protein